MNRQAGAVARAMGQTWRAFHRLPAKGRAIAGAGLAAPLVALALWSGGGASRPSLTDGGFAAPDWAPETAASAGDGTRLHGAADVIAHDLDLELALLAQEAGPAPAAPRDGGLDAYQSATAALMDSLPKDAYGNPDFSKVDPVEYQKKMAEVNAALAQSLAAPQAPTAPAATSPDVGSRDRAGIGLDEALELLATLVAETAGDDGILDAVRNGEHGRHAGALIAHAAIVLSAGDVWGAVANLLVAHERDADDATPLVNLAALANGQRLPHVALALLDAARRRDIAAGDAVAGIRERAAWLNNFGHALILAGRVGEAEAPLRQALEINPELSEAARNLAHALMQQGRADEARALVPRAVFRLPGKPDTPVPVRAASTATPDEAAASEAPAPAQWLSQPYLVDTGGGVRIPLRIALDLSRQGQIAWPEIAYPESGLRYPDTLAAAMQQLLATQGKALALGTAHGTRLGAAKARRRGRGADIAEIIDAQIVPLWLVEPISADDGVAPLDADKENRILGARSATAPAQLHAARAEYAMEQSATQLFQALVATAEALPPDVVGEAKCRAMRAALDRNIDRLMPQAREYEDRMRVFFREAYGLSTAYASNIGHPDWRGLSRARIEANVLQLHAHVQREITFAFNRAAPPSWGCYDEAVGDGAAPDIEVEIPDCPAAMQWASGKWAFGDTLSMEATCGKVKFVAEVTVVGTRKLSFGPVEQIGADLGMHAEIELDIAGTITVFAGPKGGVAAKIGGFGGDVGVKDGLYLVIGREGVRDVGFRVVMGAGVGAGPLGGSHTFEQMDASFLSAI